MTDRYEDLRAALMAGPTPGPWAHRNGRVFAADRENLTIAHVARAADGDYSPANGDVITAAHPKTIRVLLADYDRLREAAQMLADWAEHEVGAEPDLTPGLAEVRAALAQEGS